jgi:hypothetical protein
MKLVDKLKDSIADKAAEGVAASLTILLAWAAYQVAPAVLPAIEAVVSKQVLLALLVASVVLNFAFLILVWYLAKGDTLRLKYGVYWDRHKNPHCPSCKRPVSGYNTYQFGGKGYFCKPCDKVVALTDVHGKRYEPADVLGEL